MSYTETKSQTTLNLRYAYTKTEDRQLSGEKVVLPPLFDEPITWRNFHKHINWPQGSMLMLTPILAVYYGIQTPLESKTILWSIVYYFVTMFGITAGYHRYWAHRSFECTSFMRLLFCLAGAGAVQGSIQWWSRGHRAHHRWTDTDKDPYSSPRGFFFSHFGWMLVNRPKGRIGYADVEDLKADPLVRFQNKYYVYLALLMALVFPALVAHFGWGDFKGGLVFSGLCRMVLLHHATFCVNSLAHYLSDTPYDDHHTPRNSLFTAIITGGEGYHNFHHEFPYDYRNAILWYQYDPTKWLIKSLSYLGMTYSLKKFSENEIEKGRLQMLEKQLQGLKEGLKFGISQDRLPVLSLKEFKNKVVHEDKKWIILEGIVYDVEGFDHPGGYKYLKTSLGRDVTKSFNGGVYNHSNAARNLLTQMRTAVIQS